MSVSTVEFATLLKQRISNHYSKLNIDQIGRVLSVDSLTKSSHCTTSEARYVLLKRACLIILTLVAILLLLILSLTGMESMGESIQVGAQTVDGFMACSPGRGFAYNGLKAAKEVVGVVREVGAPDAQFVVKVVKETSYIITVPVAAGLSQVEGAKLAKEMARQSLTQEMAKEAVRGTFVQEAAVNFGKILLGAFATEFVYNHAQGVIDFGLSVLTCEEKPISKETISAFVDNFKKKREENNDQHLVTGSFRKGAKILSGITGGQQENPSATPPTSKECQWGSGVPSISTGRHLDKFTVPITHVFVENVLRHPVPVRQNWYQRILAPPIQLFLGCAVTTHDPNATETMDGRPIATKETMDARPIATKKCTWP